MNPKPTTVQYNNWRQVNAPPLDMRAPPPVSVIMPYYQVHSTALPKTLAALERQTYPRDMFEVIIVDDGSDPPLAPLPSTALNIRVVRQERRGFGCGRARNTGVRAASHDILLFLDSDMLVESDWLAEHVKWHCAVSDAITFGTRVFLTVDDIDSETIRQRPGSLKDLFSGRPTENSWVERVLDRTANLLAKSDEAFEVVIGSNLGMRRDFYELVGDFDESFTRWGLEDNEFGYRAYTRGGLLIPVRKAFGWHQGLWDEDRDVKRRSALIQSGRAAHLIAHPLYRPVRPGRSYTVPEYVVTFDAAHCPAGGLISAVEHILADWAHDLVVRIQTRATDDYDDLERLRNEFDLDPRVRLTPVRCALDEFPTSPFHISISSAVFTKNMAHRLRFQLGDAVAAFARLPDGGSVSITRTWALHRARRAGKSVSDFGETREISAKALNIKTAGDEGAVLPPSAFARAREWLRAVQSANEAWLFAKRAGGAAWKRAAGK